MSAPGLGLPVRDRAAAAPIGERRRFWTAGRREVLTAWLLIGPILLYYLVFSLAPLFSVVALSFFRWSGFVGAPRWVGVHNYQVLWQFPFYRDALVHTVLIGGLVLVGDISVGFAIALLLNTRVRGLAIFRAIWYMPTIVSFAIAAQMWVVCIDPSSGAFDRVLQWLHQPTIIWSLSGFWMTAHIVLLTTWKTVGGTMIIFLAGLQGIDPTLYEAARIDGAGRWALLRHITLPSLRPISVFVVVIATLGALQIFEPVQLLSHGGPFGATTVIIYRIYQDAFQNNQYGLACAMSVVFAALAMGLTITQLRFFGRQLT